MKHPRFVAPFAATLLICGTVARAGQPVSAEAEIIARIEHGLIPGTPVAGQMGRSLEERMTLYDVPAVSVAVIEDFDISWAAAWGLADRDSGRRATTSTLFQAASISKPVTAMAVHRLVQSGRVSLDTPVNEVLDSWKLPDSDLTAAAPVTFRMLLSHSAGTTVQGFPGYEPGAHLPTLLEILDGTGAAGTPPIRVESRPGERLRYSGGGLVIVQQALIDLFGQPFPVLMRETVLDPLGMSASTFVQPLPDDRRLDASVGSVPDACAADMSRVYPEMAAAGLWTTPTDLARFASAIQRALRGEQGTVISREAAEAMVTPVKGPVTPGLFLRQNGGETYFQHGGSNRGYRCMMIAHRDRGYGAVVMTNGAGGDALITEVLQAIAAVHGWHGFLPGEIQPVQLDSRELRALAGRYRIGADRAAVLTPGDGVLLHREVLRDGVVPLYPVGGDTFRYAELYPEARTFVRAADGGIRGIAIDGTEQVWDRLPDDELLPSELVSAGRTEEAIAAYRSLEAIDEDRIDDVAHWLLDDPARIEDAVALFELNTELFPDSTGAWDSLGQAASLAGRIKLAIASYERSLALDKANTRAMEALENLRPTNEHDF